MSAEGVGIGLVLTGMLLWLAVIDWRTLRLPNGITWPLIGVGLWVQTWLSGGEWLPYVVGAAVGYAVFVLIELGFRKLTGRHGLGRGDAKLLAAGGAWCGWMGLPFIVMVGSGSALLAVILLRERVAREGGRVPFGPFLAFGIGCVWWAQQLAGV